MTYNVLLAEETVSHRLTQCRERDCDGCVVTKSEEVDVVHIFPFSLHARNKRGESFRFWQMLTYF